MKVVVFTILALLLAATAVDMAYAQEATRKTDFLTIPFASANAEFLAPDHYVLTTKHVANWLMTIENKLQYNEENPEAKIVLRLKENPEDENFVEIAMLSPPSYKLWVAVANEQVGYMRVYENPDSWFDDRSITTSLVQNDRLSINNGQRIIVDRLRIGEFTLGTIEVYGRDGADADVSAFSGEITIEILSGNPLDNPITFIPAVAVAVAVGALITLLVVKKRT